jgi:FAD/FMN-containing dehydrogenase
MKLYLRGEDGFEEAAVERVFNGRRPDRRPEAVLLAESEQDVVDGVRLASERGWTVAVRSGGHSWAAWSVRDDGLLIDLGNLNDVTLDEDTGIASAGPAIKGGDELSPFLEARGRFFNGGHCPSVGIGGFLLQGGQGWNQRGWGWGAESVVAVDVVTADGELVRADASENTDLYWASRGAGPSFPGIITRFHLATRPLFGFLGHTVQVYRTEDFTEVMIWLMGIHAQISPEVEIVAVGATSPDFGDGAPRERNLIVTAVAFAADEAEGRAALAPFNGSPVLDRAVFVQDCAPSSLREQRIEQERMNPEHARYLTDNLWVQGDPEDIVAGIRPLFVDPPTPEAFAIWMSNAPMRPLPDMAFSLQTEAYVAAYTVYDDPAEDQANRSWLNRVMAGAQSVSAGQYLGDSDMTNRQLRFMQGDNFARLQAIIADRDPKGRFARYLAADPATVNTNHWED